MVTIFTRPVGCAADGETTAARRVAPCGPVAAYVLASTLGGAATGLVLALLGAPARAGGAAAAALVGGLAVLCAVACWCEWHGRMRPLVERRAQVPRSWMGWHRDWLTATAWGLMIGAGVFTYLKHAMAYVLAAIVVLAPSLETGLAIGASYGLGRGMSLGATWFADRFTGRRVGRFQPTGDVTMLNRVAAVLAAGSFVIATVFVIGG
jgi:hypothetical protein